MEDINVMEAKNKYLISEMRDEDNPAFIFNSTSTKLLVDIANKKIDAVSLAKKQLVNSGIGKSGKWVGFEKAAVEWGVK
jgi:hypothetical protein